MLWRTPLDTFSQNSPTCAGRFFSARYSHGGIGAACCHKHFLASRAAVSRAASFLSELCFLKCHAQPYERSRELMSTSARYTTPRVRPYWSRPVTPIRTSFPLIQPANASPAFAPCS